MGWIRSGNERDAACALAGESYVFESHFTRTAACTGVKLEMVIVQEDISGSGVAVGKFTDEAPGQLFGVRSCHCRVPARRIEGVGCGAEVARQNYAGELL